VISFGILKVLGLFGPVRVSEEDEIGGLDVALHGEAAYSLTQVVVSGDEAGRSRTTRPYR
jgi:ammonia channel protein AmtB